jgi:hypothetical protein
MKKIFFILFIFCSISSFTCFAQSSNNDQRIIGTWSTTNYQGTFTIVFNANGSGTYSYNFNETYLNMGPPYSNISQTFTFGISVLGELIASGQWSLSSTKIYFSPDGKILIIGTTIYNKK